MSASYFIFGFFLMNILFQRHTNSQTVQLVPNNIDTVLNGNEFVIVNFYADWCRFSQMLSPVYDSAASVISQEFPQTGKVAFAKVDCDKESGIAAQYHVSKYPTLKMFRHGSLMKKEYRGQRSKEAISTFVREQLKEPFNRVTEIEDLDELDRKKRHIIGYFGDESADFEKFAKLAGTMRDDCQFHAAVGSIADPERIAGNKLVFRPNKEMATDMLYVGNFNDEKYLKEWVQDKCLPLVREITFENAEELTEEGIPFMILFHEKDDTETPDKFRLQVARELVGEKNSVNFLTADGAKFTHPLYHLGKTVKDLPILAIDSFRHMYIWPRDVKADIDKPNLLKQFIADLHSGKLHREFHHGPDPTDQPGEGGDGGNSDKSNTAVGGHAGHNHGKNVVHFNVQQQLIVNSDGSRVQVVKLIQLGKPEGMDLRSGLKLAAESAQDVIPPLEQILEEAEKDTENKKVDVEASKELTEEKGRDDDDSDVVMPDVELDGGSDSDKVVIPDIEKDNKKDPSGDDHRHEVPWEREHVHSDGKGTTPVVYSRTKKIKLRSAVNAKRDEKVTVKTPPESMFSKLAPSNSRYSIVNRDEL